MTSAKRVVPALALVLGLATAVPTADAHRKPPAKVAKRKRPALAPAPHQLAVSYHDLDSVDYSDMMVIPPGYGYGEELSPPPPLRPIPLPAAASTAVRAQPATVR